MVRASLQFFYLNWQGWSKYWGRSIQALPLAGFLLFSLPSLANPPQGSEPPRPVPPAQPTQRLQASQITEMTDQISKAANDRDVAGIMRWLAPNITIELTTTTAPGRSSTLKLTREDYQEFLLQGFAPVRSYRHRYRDLKIQLAPDGKRAIVQGILDEEITYIGIKVTLQAHSQTELEVDLIDGKALITRMNFLTDVTASE